jgi:hypothetical protein
MRSSHDYKEIRKCVLILAFMFVGLALTKMFLV